MEQSARLIVQCRRMRLYEGKVFAGGWRRVESAVMRGHLSWPCTAWSHPPSLRVAGKEHPFLIRSPFLFCGRRVYGRAIVAERWCIHPSILVQLRRGGRVVCRQAIDPAGGKGAANTIT
ncbi:MAG: hypothetical protein R3F28_05245 [Candidatus Kapaibacterium sp.]